MCERNYIYTSSSSPAINKLCRLPSYHRLVSSTRHGPSHLRVLHVALEPFTTRDGARYWLRIANSAKATCTCAVQARRNSARVSATQSPAVPECSCYVSLGHRQQTATTLCQSSPTSYAALPTQLTWSSVLRCRWTNDLEFAVD